MQSEAIGFESEAIGEVHAVAAHRLLLPGAQPARVALLELLLDVLDHLLTFLHVPHTYHSMMLLVQLQHVM